MSESFYVFLYGLRNAGVVMETMEDFGYERSHLVGLSNFKWYSQSSNLYLTAVF